MTNARRISWLLLTVCLGCGSGCLAKHNPFYFPHSLVGTNRMVQTHPKPVGPSYFSNFDPNAVHLDVYPIDSASPVGTDLLVIATVYDQTYKARRNRRIEWMLEGDGQIIEVDESGYLPGRGGKLDNRWAYSYTDMRRHTLSRFDGNSGHDAVIEPGQTWCVIRSAKEGTSLLTVYAPEIANWNANKVTVTHRWVNAGWSFPRSIVAPAGRDVELVTHLFQPHDRSPLANYLVRYRLLEGGPPAVFVGNQPGGIGFQTQSDIDGKAYARLKQLAPQPGINKVGIEVYRADPAGGSPTFIARGETTVEWTGTGVDIREGIRDGARISMTLSGPPAMAPNRENPINITLTNNGKQWVKQITVRHPIPEGVEYIRSQPPAERQGNQLVWNVTQLEPGVNRTLQAVYRPMREGQITTCAYAATDDGYTGEQCIRMNVAVPALKITQAAPAAAVVGNPVTYQMTVTNNGSGPATNVVLRDEFDQGLEHSSLARGLELPVGTLAAGESKAFTLILKPTYAGRFRNRVTAHMDDQTVAQSEHLLDAKEVKVTLQGPEWRYHERPAEWHITLKNPNKEPLHNVELRNVVPPELSIAKSSDNGSVANQQVVWNVGTLQPGEERNYTVSTRCEQITHSTVNKVFVTVNREATIERGTQFEVRGFPAFGMKVQDRRDPVEVGGVTSYEVEVINQGSINADDVRITAAIPPELTVVSARGPSQWRREGDNLIFDKVNGLRPKQAFVYVIETRALKPGDVKVRVSLESSALTKPVIGEESTRLYIGPNTQPLTPRALPVPETNEPPLGDGGGGVEESGQQRNQSIPIPRGKPKQNPGPLPPS